MAYPKPLSEKSIERLYQQAGLDGEAQAFLHTLFAACANLYGTIELRHIWGVYQNMKESTPALRRKDLVAFSAIARRESLPYYVFEADEIYSEEPRSELSRQIVARSLVGSGYGKFTLLYHMQELAAAHPFCVPKDLLSYSNPKPASQETELLQFLGRLKVTADVGKTHFGRECPCEHKGKRLREFSFMNADERLDLEYFAKRPAQKAALLEECAGTEAEKILRRFRLEDQIGWFSFGKCLEHISEELAEVGVELTMKQMEKLMQLVKEYHNNSRLWCLSGWSPEELFRQRPRQGTPTISFGPGIQKAFADGTMDREEMLQRLRAMGLDVEEPSFD